jgi:hypothetical protein
MKPSTNRVSRGIYGLNRALAAVRISAPLIFRRCGPLSHRCPYRKTFKPPWRPVKANPTHVRLGRQATAPRDSGKREAFALTPTTPNHDASDKHRASEGHEGIGARFRDGGGQTEPRLWASLYGIIESYRIHIDVGGSPRPPE